MKKVELSTPPSEAVAWQVKYVRRGYKEIKDPNTGVLLRKEPVTEDVFVEVPAAKTAHKAWEIALASGKLPEMPAFGLCECKIISPAQKFSEAEATKPSVSSPRPRCAPKSANGKTKRKR